MSVSKLSVTHVGASVGSLALIGPPQKTCLGSRRNAATVELLDDAMEHAWQKREQWEEIGKLASTHIRERYPADSIAEFVDHIKGLGA